MMESDQIKTLTQTVNQLKEIVNNLSLLLKADNINNNSIDNNYTSCQNCYYFKSNVCKLNDNNYNKADEFTICNYYKNKKDIII